LLVLVLRDEQELNINLCIAPFRVHPNNAVLNSNCRRLEYQPAALATNLRLAGKPYAYVMVHGTKQQQHTSTFLENNTRPT